MSTLKFIAGAALVAAMVAGYFYVKTSRSLDEVERELTKQAMIADSHSQAAARAHEEVERQKIENARLAALVHQSKAALQDALKKPTIKYVSTGTDNDLAFEQTQLRLKLCLEYSQDLANQVLSLNETVRLQGVEISALKATNNALGTVVNLQERRVYSYKRKNLLLKGIAGAAIAALIVSILH